MIGLPAKVMAEGEEYIRNGYIQSFEQLCKTHMGVLYNPQLVDHVKKLTDTGNDDRAVKLWLGVAAGWDTKAVHKGMLWFGFKAVFVLSLIGAIVYLLLRG